MKAIICGGTGFIGTALTQYWLQAGHEIIIVSRKTPEEAISHSKLLYRTWDGLTNDPEPAEEAHVLVNLAGASLSQRWNARGKSLIRQSRIETGAAAGNLLGLLKSKPQVIIQASAVAIYGTSFSETFDESSPSRVMDFPSEVVKTWEDAADQTYEGVRLVKLRTGVVLGNEGGAFPKMKLPYMLGFVGKIGSGRQWLSWIHLADMVALIDYCAACSDISGPVNATAPDPVTNDRFGAAVGQVYSRPHWFPLPAFLLRAALGELSEILLKGQRVLPAKLLQHGFVFTYPDLPKALRQLRT
ncbi:TIGR01777 family oxidoreductase [Paenibacillus rhizophilus]|uniref:TIGR01777 family protein n=1 Tax=Paenibacillus rhizophilus TaxID=1850366 RepID=A0A3N9P741_9BACL|nr:TIGR01777 family oxidoreductase [Paenibacillus rhizophilus]RQW12018.1 TIGR01777 family protein [Paenibacillus rhizophilus]